MSRTPPPAAACTARVRPRRLPAVAPPQRGPRPPPDRRLRGARGVPGAGRVAQPPAARRRRRSASRPATSSPPSSPTSRWSSPCCASPTRSRARPAAGSSPSSRPSSCSRPRPSRRSPPARAPSTSSSAPPSGTPRPSASACTASPRSAPPTASPPRPATSDRDRLMVTALLHDIGKLVLMHAYPGYPAQVHQARPHARRSASTASAASSASTTRWSAASSPAAGACRRRVASVIERHHADDADGEAAFVRLADMLAHYAQGGAVSPTELLQDRARHRPRPAASCARSCTTCRTRRPAAPRQVDPCPLSDREVEVLKRLAEGKVYKQIALELAALDEHGAHAPAQHLRQARRGRPRAGRPDRHRARLAVGPGGRA